MVESFISIFTVIMIIMLAGSIAKEFSSGTVRLLLIRPRTRTQIIVSKMLAVLIVFGVLTAGVTVLANLEYMLFFGVGDMFAPDILIVGENVFAVPSFIITLLTLLIATLPALAYASVAALLAALTKKSGMSITLPVLLNVIIVELIAGIASLLYMERPDIFSWIKHSPIAYFNMSFVNGTAFWSISRYANVWLGVVYHVAFITISVWLTIISYKKAQVKG